MAEQVAALSYQDRMSPFQHEQNKLYHSDPAAFVPAMYSAIEKSAGLLSPRVELKLEHTDLHPIEEMASAPLNLRLLQFLVSLSGARRILEIGSFIGVSATYMARALPEGGTLTTIEKFDHFADIARKNLESNGVADRVRLILGDAMEVLDTLEGEEKFDFVLIDGDKGRYPEYFRKVDKLLDRQGLVVIDDVLFHGDALNSEPTTDKGKGARGILDLIATRPDYQRVTLPIANGILLARKL